MLAPLTVTIVALATGATLLALLYAARDRLINDGVLAILAIIEVAVVVQLVVGMVRLGQLTGEKATFAAYLMTLPFLLPFATLLAIKEKSRWAMVTVAVGAFAVAVMTVRLGQIWDAHV